MKGNLSSRSISAYVQRPHRASPRNRPSGAGNRIKLPPCWRPGRPPSGFILCGKRPAPFCFSLPFSFPVSAPGLVWLARRLDRRFPVLASGGAAILWQPGRSLRLRPAGRPASELGGPLARARPPIGSRTRPSACRLRKYCSGGRAASRPSARAAVAAAAATRAPAPPWRLHKRACRAPDRAKSLRVAHFKHDCARQGCGFVPGRAWPLVVLVRRRRRRRKQPARPSCSARTSPRAFDESHLAPPIIVQSCALTTT